ncbi:MAG: hypothetical protein OZ921_02965 [Sorangiineae bacterium]|nr:hypothetical protein [Polyangiaceae bacterium]MEB2321449.1 hypothetical protein [Sorangiineae bacterium]
MVELGPDDDDIESLKAPLIMRLAGIALGLDGVFTVVLALQNFVGLPMRAPFIAVSALTLCFGVALTLIGVRTAGARGWAAIAGTVVAGLFALADLTWVVFEFAHGVVSLLALGLVPLSALAAILAGFAIPAGLQADKARFRLDAQGFKPGF